MIKPMLVLAAGLFAAPVLAQEAAPAAPALPTCSAKVTDGCVQSAAAEKRAMSGEQADKRDAAHGGAWTPDGSGKTAKAKAGTPAPN